MSNIKASVVKNVKTTKVQIVHSQKEAVDIANRAVKIYKKSDKRTTYLMAGRTKKLISIVTPANLPVIGFIVGAVTPAPFTNLIFTVAGAVAGVCWWGCRKVQEYKKQNNEDKNKLNKII